MQLFVLEGHHSAVHAKSAKDSRIQKRIQKTGGEEMEVRALLALSALHG